MNNLILFLNAFMSYLLVFAVIVILVIIAVIMGIKLRKNKDKKTQLESGDDGDIEVISES